MILECQQDNQIGKTGLKKMFMGNCPIASETAEIGSE